MRLFGCGKPTIYLGREQYLSMRSLCSSHIHLSSSSSIHWSSTHFCKPKTRHHNQSRENQTKHHSLPSRHIIMKLITPLIAIACIASTVSTDIRTDIMVYCNTHFADCLAICNGKPGNIPLSGCHDHQQMDMPNGLTGLGFRLIIKSDNWWMHYY